MFKRLAVVTCLALAIVAVARAADDVSLKAVPPVVVKTVPEAGSDGVDTSVAEIRVTFSKEMKDGSWSWSTLSKESFPEASGKAALSR